MAFGSSMSMMIIIILSCLGIISLGGMGVITTAIFNVTNNTVSISDSQLVMGKITLGFYWALCIIAFVLTVYIYGVKN